MPDRLNEINEIVKYRHRTGEYGGAHFKLATAIWDEMRRSATPAPVEHSWMPSGGLGALLGIPVVVDDGLPPGTWRLVETATGDVLREGVVPVTDVSSTDVPMRAHTDQEMP